MRCASALSTARNTQAAASDVLGRVAEGLAGEPADLAVLFSTLHHADSLDAIASEVRARGLGRHLIGCTGESIAGDGKEIEGSTALCLWSISLPGASLDPVRLTFGDDAFSGGIGPESTARDLLMLADPFTFPTDRWLAEARLASPGLRVFGGMASAGQAPGQNRLILDGEVFDDGAVGLSIGGEVAIRTVVSQGCRPIGRPLIVTRADRNLIAELGRRPALEVLREIFEGLDDAEQALVREGLHVGRVINEYQESFGRGDFLIRNVLGADPSRGIAIGDLPRVGQTVQFHVRDAATADEDLRSMLSSALDPSHPPVGALLFTCNGRGSRLFPGPDHDISTILDIFGPLPSAGFFAMGELGPIGGQNFVHGFTASVALFGPRAG